MSFTLTWHFEDASNGSPIDGLPITISWIYANANCFGSVNQYTPVVKTTDSNGDVSMGFGSGACGSDQITVSFAGNAYWLGVQEEYNVGVNRGGETTYTVYVTPVKTVTVFNTTTTSESASGAITSGQSAQAQATAAAKASSLLSSLGASAQSDFEIIAILAAIIGVIIAIVVVLKMRSG